MLNDLTADIKVMKVSLDYLAQEQIKMEVYQWEQLYGKEEMYIISMKITIKITIQSTIFFPVEMSRCERIREVR